MYDNLHSSQELVMHEIVTANHIDVFKTIIRSISPRSISPNRYTPPPPGNIIKQIVSTSKIEYLDIIFKTNIDFPYDIANIAAVNGHVECLKYLFYRGYKTTGKDVFKTAIVNDHLECVKYMYFNDCPIVTDSYELAVSSGSTKCIEYFDTNKKHNAKSIWGEPGNYKYTRTFRRIF